jgi:hypothetical protein
MTASVTIEGRKWPSHIELLDFLERRMADFLVQPAGAVADLSKRGISNWIRIRRPEESTAPEVGAWNPARYEADCVNMRKKEIPRQRSIDERKLKTSTSQSLTMFSSYKCIDSPFQDNSSSPIRLSIFSPYATSTMLRPRVLEKFMDYHINTQSVSIKR